MKNPRMREGGLTSSKIPNDKIFKITSNVISHDYIPIEYKTQVVAGVNYFIKVKSIASGHMFIYRIYEDLQGNFRIDGVRKINSFDSIEYF